MASLRIIEPAKGCVTRGDLLQLEIETCEVPFVDYTYEVYLNGSKIPVNWCDSPWKGRMFAPLPRNLPVGGHGITVVRTSRFGEEEVKTSFWALENLTDVLKTIGINLMDYVKRMNPPHDLGWGWGEGLFLEGCTRFSGVLHDDPAVDRFWYAKRYHDFWWGYGVPTIDKSDSCSPGLSALSLLQGGNKNGSFSLNRIISYIENAPRNSVGALNHLGSSYSNWFYPRSIWVDSLMMYGTLAVRAAAYMGKDSLLNFGLDQFEIFADKLQDPTVGLWRHAWLERFDHTVPETETYWLRGNGWALAAHADVLEHVPADSPRRERLVGIFKRTLEGLLLLQQDNGLWDSVANIPGYTYPESSGSLLIAYAIVKGIRSGWLDRKYLGVSERVANAVASRITYDTKNYPFPVTLHDISGPTNPMPRWVYGMIQEDENALYGVGVYLMLCKEIVELERGR